MRTSRRRRPPAAVGGLGAQVEVLRPVRALARHAAEGEDCRDLPGPENESQYFKLLQYLDRAFYEEMKRRLDTGSILVWDNHRRDYPENTIAIANSKIISLFQTKTG